MISSVDLCKEGNQNNEIEEYKNNMRELQK